MYVTHIMAYSKSSSHYTELHKALKSLTKVPDIDLGDLWISTCPPWQCSLNREPMEVRQCFKPFMSLQCPTEPGDPIRGGSRYRDPTPAPSPIPCVVGYQHFESCGCTKSDFTQPDQNITWIFLNETMKICQNEKVQPYRETTRSSLFDTRVDKVVIHSNNYSTKITLQVCRPRECAKGYNIVTTLKPRPLSNASLGGATLYWQDEECACSNNTHDGQVEEFRVTVETCHGKNITTTLRNITALLNQELEICETMPKNTRQTPNTKQREGNTIQTHTSKRPQTPTTKDTQTANNPDDQNNTNQIEISGEGDFEGIMKSESPPGTSPNGKRDEPWTSSSSVLQCSLSLVAIAITVMLRVSKCVSS